MRYLFLLITALLVSNSLHAQVSINPNFNVVSQPVWGPVGYDQVEYYYLPDIETYYYVPQHKFFYYQGGRWVGSSQLPTRYGDYDFYNSYKVVVNEPKPYQNHKMYRDQNASYKGRRGQQPIRDSHDSRYFVIKSHPEHTNWVKLQKSNNGNGKGKGNSNKHNAKKN